MTDRDRVRECFEQALDHEGEERCRFVAEYCGDDEALCAEVRSLLAAHDSAESFLDRPTRDGADEPRLSLPPIELPPHESPGTVIGRYRLIEQIGEGGFGSVFLAEQLEPVRRNIALKVVKLGMDTKQVVARFEIERQALALMSHPNIAKVLDAGATQFGRPYFVMEYVQGSPLTTYCEEHQLDTRERLELFISVCQGVQHVHQKGLIHRDLKPSNLLVATVDDAPVPKVIDFGIAKAITKESSDETRLTRHHQFVGTPEYMSPEQIESSEQDIDTRSDIYSLGAILYELLTGTTPFERERLRGSTATELRRVLCEETPPPPSQRIHATRTTERQSARKPGDTPRPTEPTFRHDLDWIVMRCLEKERERRYETVNGLAMDLRRYLDDRPVNARPPSLGYSARKLVHRNKGAFVAITLIVGLAVLGSLGTGIGLMASLEANRALGEAWQAEREQVLIAKANLELAAKNERRAREEAERARLQEETTRAFNEFITNDLFSVARPTKDESSGGPFQLRSVLEQATACLEAQAGPSGRFANRPRVEAQIRMALARAQMNLRNHAEAELQLSRAVEILNASVGEHDLDLRRALAMEAELYIASGNSQAAIHALESLLGDDSLADVAARDARYADLAYTLARCYLVAERNEEAMVLLERVLRHQESGRETAPDDILATKRELASALEISGRLDEALTLFEDLHRSLLEHAGESDRRTLEAKKFVAIVHRRLGGLETAIRLGEEVVRDDVRVLGPENVTTLYAIADLATSYRAAGRFEDALRCWERIVDTNRAALGAGHPDTLSAKRNLARALTQVGRHAESAALFRSILRRQIDLWKREDHPQVTSTRHWLRECRHLATELEADEDARQRVVRLYDDAELEIATVRLDPPPP